MVTRLESDRNGRFPTTQRSVLRGLRSEDPLERSRSLERLAQTYWKPIFNYLRLRWHKDVAEAQEITQEFFVRCIGKGTFASYVEDRARFRTFVRMCLDRFVLDLARREHAEKRGGTRSQSVDVGTAEWERIADPATLDPEALFEAEWARSVVDNAVESLRAACVQKGKDIHFRVFERVHLASDPTKPSYAAIANELGISIVDVTNRLSYARRELRAIILEALRELTTSDEELRNEARTVFGIEL
ncbi:MAG TPA: sigma-70 family RNA polymerase sigma factor [Polyangiaceae bacterium]|nr:sigma-70 family RNA polymerase sigma factor [Polyangiaceae bacterium]